MGYLGVKSKKELDMITNRRSLDRGNDTQVIDLLLDEVGKLQIIGKVST